MHEVHLFCLNQQITKNNALKYIKVQLNANLIYFYFFEIRYILSQKPINKNRGVMDLKKVELEMKLYYLINEKEMTIIDTEYEHLLNEIRNMLEEYVAILTPEENQMLKEYFVSDKSRKIIINELNMTENKYYYEIRKIIKKSGNIKINAKIWKSKN